MTSIVATRNCSVNAALVLRRAWWGEICEIDYSVGIFNRKLKQKIGPEYSAGKIIPQPLFLLFFQGRVIPLLPIFDMVRDMGKTQEGEKVHLAVGNSF